MVLNLRSDDVIACVGDTKDREIISLSAAAGEDDLRSAATKQTRHRFPRALHRSTSMLPMLVDGGSVPELLQIERTHRLENLRQKRRGRIAIQINALHIDILCSARNRAASFHLPATALLLWHATLVPMRRLIVNADDFGMTSGVNRAIAESHKSGVVTSATVMANEAAVDEAILLASQNPSLATGCHVVLVDGAPLSQPDSVQSLIGSRNGDLARFRPGI